MSKASHYLAWLPFFFLTYMLLTMPVPWLFTKVDHDQGVTDWNVFRAVASTVYFLFSLGLMTYARRLREA